MSLGWWWLAIAWVTLILAWVIINGAMGHLCDRRYARLIRDVERKKLRYEAWRRVGRIRSW
jgi:hypothetical protein